MVTIEFTEEPERDDVEEFIERIQPTGNIQRGVTGSEPFVFDQADERLLVNWDDFKRVFLEHRQFDEAQGFTATELELLRALEAGPERMFFDEIESQVEIAESTIYKYLKKLEEKDLVYKPNQNAWVYIGP